MNLIDFINDIQIFGGKITSPYSEITWPYFAITHPYSEITHPYSKILQEYLKLLRKYSKLLRKYSKIVPEYAEIVQICNFAATLLPPIFPLNRAFNAIWWQGGSKI